MSAIQSVIKYVEGFKKEDLTRTKLKSVNSQGRGDGVEMCASFDKGGIECLLYVLEDFAIAASSLNITTTLQHIEFFKKILGHGPSEKFKRLLAKNPILYVDRIVQQQQQDQQGQMIEVNVTVVGSGFQALMKDFIKMYCTSTDSKGDLIEYLKSEDCRKPMKAEVATHQDRIEELMRFSKMLEGSRPNLTEEEQKLILFRSFPLAWQINWNRTQVSPQSATVEKLMQYMNNEKQYADAEWKKNHKKKDNNKGDNKNGYQGRGGRGRGYQGRGGRGRGREGRGGRGQGRGDNERCRQHDGEHLWKLCPANFNSPAGKAAGAGRGRGGRDGGRGRGRGGYESYHTNSYHQLPPPPYYGSPVGGSLRPPPVSQVSVSPSENHYYAQHGGTQPPSIAPTQEFYMCSDGNIYPRH